MNNVMEQDIKKVLVSEEEIREKVAEIGARISEDYAGKNLLMGSLIKDISGAEMNVSVRRAGAAEPCFEEPADKRE